MHWAMENFANILQLTILIYFLDRKILHRESSHADIYFYETNFCVMYIQLSIDSNVMAERPQNHYFHQ